MTIRLLMPIEVDRILRYPAGRYERLAKRGKLPCVRLPGGTIRFRELDVERLISPGPNRNVAMGGVSS